MPRHLHAFSTPYALKHDTLRQSRRWTAIGPDGRIGDYDTRDEAVAAIAAHAGKPPTFGDQVTATWGGWWPVSFEG